MSALRQIVARLALYAVLFFLAAALPVFSSRAAAAPASEAGIAEADGLELSVGSPQKEALLSILYNASTYGELHPCPT